MVSNQPVYLYPFRQLSLEKRGSVLSDVVPLANPGNVDHPFATALQDVAGRQLRQDAWRDVRNLALTGLGVGVGGAGLIGLVKSLKRNLKPKPHLKPSIMPLPLPVEEEEKRAAITAKAGLPWYGPAMLFGGLGGLALGWKGVDAALAARARKEREQEMTAAQQEFHDALLSQHDRPLARGQLADTALLKAAGEVVDREDCPHCGASMERGDDGNCNTCGKPWPAKSAGDNELGTALDRLFDNVQTALEKRGGVDNVLGGLAGGYGMYAGLSGLLTGAIVFNKMKKRSRQAVLEKALQKRDRRRFAMQPDEIYAAPTPVPTLAAGSGSPGMGE